MKSLTMLWSVLANEYASRCCTSATRDIKTVTCRVEDEGLSFLTITLPSFGKDFQKGLDQGIVDRNSFQGFSWRGGLPRFLGGFLDRVFNRDSGVLVDEPDIEAILAIRQLTLLFSKILLPCSQGREKAAMDEYINCDREVKENDSFMVESDYNEFNRMSHLLFGDLFHHMDKLVYDEDLVPKHGPGATADKLMGNQKFNQRTWTDRLQEVFSFENFLFPNPRFCKDEEVTFLEPGSEIPVKVISVPKTLKTPRIIAIEPTCMQYMQQALLEKMIEFIEGDSILNTFLGFSDQVPNQDLAKEGSESGDLATLDLSEASDRVSNQLVRCMLQRHPWFSKAVEATRSRKARVPGKGVHRLAKFASMGSALCFPMEAMVFLTIIFLGIEKERSTHFVSRDELLPYFNRVRVYGDDLIVPSDDVESVILSLEHFGARVGRHKSFWTGRFRESCGKEFYDGIDVSIVKLRRVPPTSLSDVPAVISHVSFANQLFGAGCWETVRYVDSTIRKVLKYYPVIEETSPVLGCTSFMGYKPERMCAQLHRPLVKGYVIRPVLPKNSLSEHGALLKYFLKRGNFAHADVKHLERSGRPRAVDIKPRWVPPY